MKQIEKMGKSFVVLLLACLIATVFLLSACGGDNDNNSNINIESNAGDLPVFKGGDTWTQRGPINGTECTIVFTVTGEDTVNGRGTYVVEGLIEPPLSGVVDKMVVKMDKNNLFPLEGRMYSSGMNPNFDWSITYTRRMTGAPYYPMKVGNVSTVESTETIVTETNGEKETETETYIEIYKVEKVEDVTVPAGTFTCFKIVQYNENEEAQATIWESEDVKYFDVKKINEETNEILELISYSINE